MKSIVIAILLLFIFSVLTISSQKQWSGTCDEIAHHIPVGYVMVTKGDFKLDTSHPPLSRIIAGMPLKLFLRLNLPDSPSAWRVEDRSQFGRDFFFKYNNNPRQILFFSRLAFVFMGILCGIILFIWINKLYGIQSALFGLFLYSFCPNIIANSGLATTDITATCFILLSLFSFWLFLKIIA